MSDLILVVPCYNEAQRFAPEAYAQFLRAHPAVRFCFVDDGSRDETRALLETFCARFPRAAQLVVLARHQGKAAAVRAGMLHVLLMRHPNANDYVGFWDADLAAPLSESLRFAKTLDANPQFDCVFGSRKTQPGARIERNFARQAVSRVVTFFIRRYLGFNVRDSQCGAKIFRADVVLPLFAQHFVSHWLFDVELFKRMRQPTRQVCELPLNEWRDVAGSKLKFYHGAKIIFELVRIAFTYHTKKKVVANDRALV